MSVIGIDFGASRLRIAVERDQEPQLLHKRSSSDVVPFVYQAARETADARGIRFQVFSLKRLLDFDRAIPVPPGGMSSLDCLAKMLREVRAGISGEESTRAPKWVLAVPPCFSQRQRSALRTAATLAGLTPAKLVDDTRAVVLACGDNLSEYQRILVYSWGASTFSTALYRPRGPDFEPLAQEGSLALGGADVDAALAGAILTVLDEQRCFEDLVADVPELLERALDDAQRARPILASGRDVSIPLTRLLGRFTNPGIWGKSISLTQADYQSIVVPMVRESLRLVEQVLSAGNCPLPEALLVAGGMGMLPAVRSALSERFRAPFVYASEDAVATGAMLYGSMLPQSEWDKVQHAAPELDDEQSARPADLLPPSPSVHRRANFHPVQDAEPASERWADNFVPLLDAAQHHQAVGRLDQAIETFEQLFVELAKFSTDLYQKKASKLVDEGRDDQAFPLLQVAHRRDPANRFVGVDFAQTCVRLGADLLRRKQLANAVAVTQKGIDAIRPLAEVDVRQYGALLAQLLHLDGGALSQLGRQEEAEEELAEAVQLDPTSQGYLQDLRTVRDALKKARLKRPVAGSGHGSERNLLCPCNSGKKWKKCCGRPR